MKIIDLLNKIANGEEVPEKFRFAGLVFERQGCYIKDEEGDSIFDSMFTDFSNLNDEVEILEKKKIPEKIYWDVSDDKYTTYINGKKCKACRDSLEELSDMYRQKINELLDYLESKGE